MNKKKSGILTIWLSLFIFFTFLTFFIIGTNSDYLVKNTFKNISLLLMIISIISLIIGIVLVINYKHHKIFSKVVMVHIMVLGTGLLQLQCLQ